MRSLARSFLVLAICIINSCSSISDLRQRDYMPRQENFLIVDRLSDNEKETRFKWRDLMGKETTLDMDAERYANSSLEMTSLWQITNGRKFAQLIFSGENLIDCEFLKDGGPVVDDFVDKFIEEFNFIRHGQRGGFDSQHHMYHESSNVDHAALSIKPNVTFVNLKRLREIPEHFVELMNLKKIQKKCNQLHRQIRQKLQNETGDEEDAESDFGSENANARAKRQSDSWFLAPNTKWCGKGNSADHYKELGASRGDACCRKHDHCFVNIHGMQKKFGLFNFRPFAISHCKCDRRSRRAKRDLNNFIIPYTKWCGKGWLAKKYSEIGGFSKTDKCCRSHDFCPHWIGGFEQKWSLFNWSINVIMHCKCDERFRTCLKMASSSDANMVGKLFFNIVQIKCFVLKPEKTCILYSWWGKCLKYKTKKKAYLRDNQKY